MQIARDYLRFDLKQAGQVFDRVQVVMIYARVFHIPDVLADDNLISLDIAEGIFQIGTRGENVLFTFFLSNYRRRYVPARPPQQDGLSVDKVHNRIVNLPVNLPVVHQKCIGNFA